MDEEIKKLLKENLELTRQTNTMVKKLHRQMIWQRIKFIIKLILLIAMVYLSYKFIPPLLNQFIAPFQNLLGIPGQVQGLQGLPNFQGLSPDLLKQLPNQLQQLQQFLPKR